MKMLTIHKLQKKRFQMSVEKPKPIQSYHSGQSQRPIQSTNQN